MQETSAKDFTGRVRVRKSEENAIAGRLARKGEAGSDGIPCEWRLLREVGFYLRGMNARINSQEFSFRLLASLALHCRAFILPAFMS